MYVRLLSYLYHCFSIHDTEMVRLRIYTKTNDITTKGNRLSDTDAITVLPLLIQFVTTTDKKNMSEGQ